ncbi:siderophore-interacting protein [Parasphingorhabdus pacifica]
MSTTAQATTTRTSYRFATVRSVESVTPNMLRVGFEGADLRWIVGAGPDQYVKLFFPIPGQARPQLPEGETEYGMSWYRAYLDMPDDVRPAMRTYTVRALRPSLGEIDVDFVLHGDDGPASRWARRARPGDEVAMIGPHGIYAVPPEANWQLLVGDETAVPAIAAIVESLPREVAARVFVETGSEVDEQHFDTPADVDIRWLPRGSAPRGQRLLEALRADEFPAGFPYAWLAGEAGVVKHVRRHLVSERGFEKRAITFTGYWRQGKSEEDTGRAVVQQRDRVKETED